MEFGRGAWEDVDLSVEMFTITVEDASYATEPAQSENIAIVQTIRFTSSYAPNSKEKGAPCSTHWSL